METRPKNTDDNVSGNPSSTTAGSTVGAMAGRAHSALDSTIEKVAPTVNRMVDKAHEAIDRVADRASPTADKMDSTMRMMDSWAENVRARPLAAVGMALAVGYIIGRLRS